MLSCAAGNVPLRVAQQLEDRGAGFFQRDSIVRAEAAVRIAADPALLDRNADVGCIGGAAAHIRKEGTRGALGLGAFPVGGERHHQFGQRAAGKRCGQVCRLVGGQAAQRNGCLDCRVGAAGRGGQDEHGAGHADRQQQRKNAFLHKITSFLSRTLIR